MTEGRREQLREATAREASRGRMLAADQEARRRYEAGLVARFHVKTEDLVSEPLVWEFKPGARDALVQGRLW